jgi:hypothetical protein
MEAVTPLEVAQRFNAGSFIVPISSPFGTKELSCRPVRDLFPNMIWIPSAKALGYCRRIEAAKLKQKLPR